MKKYSKVYRHQYGRDVNLFRYNYESRRLECVYVPEPDDLDSIRKDCENSKLDWMRKDAEVNLDSYKETGYVIITSEGLLPENWEEDKEFYMDKMSENIACEIKFI